jgi:hypothetical protein
LQPSVAATASPSSADFDIQVAALGKQAAAAALRDSLIKEFPTTRIEEAVIAGAPFFRVRIGQITTSTEAARIEERLRELGHAPVRYGGRKHSG